MIPIAKPLIGVLEKEAVIQVLDSGILAQGKQVEAFEREFAEYCGAAFAVATSSGTTALHLALLASGIGPGDEVITTPFTFIATANAILYVGARPIFVDINPYTFNIDTNQIESVITSKTKAILPVHLYGLPADMHYIERIAECYNLVVVEDACQAHGASYYDEPIGGFGTCVFSFYPSKNMTSGEGGMITTDSHDVAEIARILRNHGTETQYHHSTLGYNYRMTDIHAAIGRVQLARLENFNIRRRINASYFDEHLRFVVTPIAGRRCRHVYHQYTIRVPANIRQGLLEYLRQEGIDARVYYPVPIHMQPFYAKQLGPWPHFPEAELAATDVLSLPVHPSIQLDDLIHIAVSVNRFVGGPTTI